MLADRFLYDDQELLLDLAHKLSIGLNSLPHYQKAISIDLANLHENWVVNVHFSQGSGCKDSLKELFMGIFRKSKKRISQVDIDLLEKGWHVLTVGGSPREIDKLDAYGEQVRNLDDNLLPEFEIRCIVEFILMNRYTPKHKFEDIVEELAGEGVPIFF